MARVLYFDCFSGISGDMLIGACLDAGLPVEALKDALGSLALDAAIDVRKVLRCGVSATKFDVVDPAHGDQAHTHPGLAGAAREHHHGDGHSHDHGHPHAGGLEHSHDHQHAPGTGHHSLAEIEARIERSALSMAGKRQARALFRRLAEAEAAIHAMPVEQVHLHEVGALDSIIDVVGAVFALEWIGADRVVCSPLNVGGGMVRSAHGIFPVPAPATVRLLGDAPVYAGAVQKELVTPTGALLATGYATAFGPVPAMSIERVGYGAGARDNPETPNVLRVLIGRSADQRSTDRVVVLECDIDDMNPQLFGVVMDRLYAAGALDVCYLPVQMKKNRPGTRLTVVAPPALRSALSAIVFNETTTLGVRYHEMEREVLAREIIDVPTPLGPIRLKVARRDGRIVNVAPEFEDCVRLAAAHGRTVKDIQALALQVYGNQAQTDGRTA